MRSWIGMTVSLLVAALVAAAPGGARGDAVNEMRAGAAAFLQSLDEEQKERAGFTFEDSERLDWHFIPRERKGISLGSLTDVQRIRLHRLLRSALSAQGYLKVQGVLLLEQVLYELESRPTRPASHRDPGRYFVSVFGAPGGPENGPWGWRIEGHHLSLNFSSVSDELFAATPFFLGANPDEVRSGAMSGLRVLGAEESLARELVRSLDDEQRKRAVRDGLPPADILFGPGTEVNADEQEGLSAAGMNADQRRLLRRLLDEYVGNLRGELAEPELARIEMAGLDGLRFLWIGGVEGERFYYRVQGSHFAIEYDVVAENHVHTVWRDRENDFLRWHYQEAHKDD